MKFSKLMWELAGLGTKQNITLFFDDGLIIRSEDNTGVFESTNCLDLDDPDYLEYYDFGFEVTKLINLPKDVVYPYEIKEGIFLALFDFEEPRRIEDNSSGNVIWQKED